MILEKKIQLCDTVSVSHFQLPLQVATPTVPRVSVVLQVLKKFYRSLTITSWLHYLLPPPRQDICYKLRHTVKFEPPTAKSVRFQNSFIVYALNNYQSDK